MHANSRAPKRTLTTVATTLAFGSMAVVMAASASAHVTVNTTDARQGGYGKVTVRVPNESETAVTTKVSIAMPTSSVLRSVKVKAHPGWTSSAPKVKLAKPVTQGDKIVTEAVATITWTADKGVSIKADSFDEFEFSVGQLPTDKTSLSFPALQTYSDGKVVGWIEPVTPGGAEPKHPAPVLDLLPSKTAKPSAAAPSPSAKAGKDSVARSLGAGAVIVAVGGAGLGLRRKRLAA
ncbi:MAG: hypothetical protein QOF35_2257 [Actinomycetota bacterium]|jgi:uncharacterized protein YcnI|nr:hypothetical protein [Actinomycetota bacterium]